MRCLPLAMCLMMRVLQPAPNVAKEKEMKNRRHAELFSSEIFVPFISPLTTAAAKKVDTKKGPSAPERVKTKVQCSLCKIVNQSVKELKAHFEAKHPKDVFDEATHSIAVA